MLLERLLNVLDPLLPVGDQGHYRPIKVVVTAQSYRAGGCVQVLRPKSLEELCSIESVLNCVIDGFRKHLTDLAQVRGLDEDFSDCLIALVEGLYFIPKKLTNFINVEVVGGNQRVCGTLVQPLGGIP